MNQAILAGWSRMRGTVESISEPEREVPPVNVPPKRSAPVSAPVSRAMPSMTTGSAIPTRVTLSPEEVQVARTSFTDPSLTNAEREKMYYLNKVRMLQMRKAGTLNE
jgi:hypothetical protein